MMSFSVIQLLPLLGVAAPGGPIVAGMFISLTGAAFGVGIS